MNAPLVKMCGITRPRDAEVAIAEGASFVGLIFVKSSSRFVDDGAASEVAAVVKGSASGTLVGVFVNESVDVIEEKTARFDLDLVQLHGEEEDDLASRLSRPVIRAVRVRDERTELAPSGEYAWVLYDSWVEGSRGGSGVSFDWELLKRRRAGSRVMLSGGLDPANVRRAIEVARPDAVDVASGIESEPGIKDHGKIREFMEQVRHGQTIT